MGSQFIRQLQGMVFPQIPDLSGLDLPEQAFEEVDDIETADIDPTSGEKIPDLPNITSGVEDPTWNPEQGSLPLMDLDGAMNDKKNSTKLEKSEIGEAGRASEVDVKTAFWHLVYNKLKWSRQEGQNVLQSCGGDFSLAMVKIKQQMPG